MYLNISCICYNNTVNHLKFGQQLYWIYTEGKSLIMKLGQDQIVVLLILLLTADSPEGKLWLKLKRVLLSIDEYSYQK